MFSLTLAPPTPGPPEDDNTAAARAARAPLYILSAAADPDARPDPLDVLARLFDTAPRHEWVRLRLPAPSAAEFASLGVAQYETGDGEDECDLLVFREAFWQLASERLWLRVPQTTALPLVHATPTRTPLRPAKPLPGTTIYERAIRHLGDGGSGSVFGLRVLDVGSERDVKTFSDWQNVRLSSLRTRSRAQLLIVTERRALASPPHGAKPERSTSTAPTSRRCRPTRTRCPCWARSAARTRCMRSSIGSLYVCVLPFLVSPAPQLAPFHAYAFLVPCF